MKIQFKRNQNAATTLLPPLSAGEPLWFKDKLYIGSTGATGISGGPTAGDAQLLVDPKSLILSTSAQTYFQTGPYLYTLALPAADPYSTARTPTAHAFTGSEHTGISTSNLANKDLLWYDNANSTWKNGTIANILTGVTIPSGSYNNQKIKSRNTSGALTFPDNAEVEIFGDYQGTGNADLYITTLGASTDYVNRIQIVHLGPDDGNDITAKSVTTSGTGENSNAAQSVTLGTAFKIPYIRYNAKGHITGSGTKDVTVSHPTTYTAHTSVGGLSGTTLTVPIVSNDTQGHVSGLTSSSIEFTHAPVGNEKVLTSSDLTGITGAMVYKGTIGTGGTITSLPAAGASNKGNVYMVKTAGTYANQACETGDMIISNGTSWDVINGENQVTNSGNTLAWNSAVTIATVDGTSITAKLPVNPNTDYNVLQETMTGDKSYPILTRVSEAGSNNSTSTSLYNDSAYIIGESGIIGATGFISSVEERRGPNSFWSTDGYFSDISISSGVITIGSSSITPLTSWNESNNYAFKTITPEQSTGTSALTTNLTNSVVAGTNTATLSLAAGNKWIGIAGDNTAKKITIAHQGPDTNGAMIPAVTSAAFKKVAYDKAGHITGSTDVTIDDITGLSGWTAVQNATLKVKTSTNTSPSGLFSANASNAGVLFIKAGNKISTSNSTATASNTVTNTVTIDHSAGDTAGASKPSTGGVNGDTITVPIISTDAYGHVSSLTSTEWTYTAPAAPKDGKLQLKVGTGGTATDSGFSANTNTDTPLIFNDTAVGAKFSINSRVISIIEIDGGLID
jgi:hypothetical protein